MKITILSTGSRGDTQPYVALGKALKSEGCQVRLAAFNMFGGMARENGLDFFPVRGDVQGVMASGLAGNTTSADNPLKVMRSFKRLQGLVFDLQEDFFNACEGVDRSSLPSRSGYRSFRCPAF